MKDIQCVYLSEKQNPIHVASVERGLEDRLESQETVKSAKGGKGRVGWC